MVSILDSIKQMLGISLEDTSFDKELIMHINGALTVLTQLGVGPVEGFSITGKDQNWEDLLGERKDLNFVMTDVFLRVRLIFDPPANSFLVASIDRQIKEYDWRIESWHDPKMSMATTYEVSDSDDDCLNDRYDDDEEYY